MFRKLKAHNRKINNSKGSALLYVLLVTLLLAMASASMLIVASNSAKQSSFAEQYEQMYYDAESIVNIADAIFRNNIESKRHTLIDVEGDNETDVANTLKRRLEDLLDESKMLVESELKKIYPDIDFDVGRDINYDIHEKAIMAEPLDNKGRYISFFGGGLYSDSGSDDVPKIKEVTPFSYYIEFTSGSRKVRMDRSYTVKEREFFPSEGGGDSGGGGSGGGGFWLSGNGLLNSVHDWVMDGDRVVLPQGIDMGFLHPGPVMQYPSNNRDDLMGGTISTHEEVNRIKNIVESILSTSDVYRVDTWNPNPFVITPDMLRKPDGTYFNAINSTTCPIVLVGNFTLTGLKAVYGNQGVRLGDSSGSFSCDRSSAETPLYIYGHGSPSTVTFSGPSKISNMIMGCANVLTIQGNSGDEDSIYCDAQFYSNNVINIGSSWEPLVVNNWDVTGVPSFITPNTVGLHVRSETGFSSIVYSDNSSGINVDAPNFNGLFLMSGLNSPMTFRNSSTTHPGPVRLYCEINEIAYNNLHDRIKQYLKTAPLEEGTSGGPILSRAARHIIFSSFSVGNDGTENDVDEKVSFEIVPISAVIREIDIEP